ncbi:MAG: MATE family efflux transporter [Halanaerobiales bacterium]
MDLKRKSERLGKEPVVSLLFRLSIPSIIAMVVQALYNVVDSIYLGRLSTDALSALTLTFPLQIIIIGIAVGTGVGTSSLISRLMGRGNKKRASIAAEHVFFISLIYGIAGIIVGILFSDMLLQFFTSDPELIAMGTEYISIIFIGSIALFFPIIGNNILRGEGNTVIPMIAISMGAVINIILDPFMIFGIGFFPAWGIKGAAIATVLARIISGIFLVFILFSDKNEIKFNLKEFEFDFSIIKEIYSVGFPAMVMQFLASFMLGGMNRILGSFSSTAIAAAGVYFRLQSFVFMPVFGLNQGYMPLVGYNFGHNNPKRIIKAIKSAFAIAIAFTGAGFILFQFFSTQLITMFNNDPELLTIGSNALETISLAFPVIGLMIIMSATFQAIGKGWPSLMLSFFRQIIILLPLMYLLGKVYGLSVLWYSFPISETMTLIPASFWLYKTLKNKFREMRLEYGEV